MSAVSMQEKYKEPGQFVGYLADGAKSITQYPNEGFFTLYDAPTLLSPGDQYFFAGLYEKYNENPYGALQAFGGLRSGVNTSGKIEYGHQSFDPRKGTLIYDGMERYAVALEPKLQNPDWEMGSLTPDEMAYGTALDVTIQLDNQTYYIPAIIVDVKAHTAPTGIFQTGISCATGEYVPSNSKNNIVEWYVDQGAGAHNKSAGLNKFNTNGSVIVYRDEVLK